MAPLTVLLVHERYRQPGGEDVAVEADAALLEQAGHRVVRLVRSNDDIDEHTLRGRVAVAGGTLWSRRAAQEVRRLVDEARPDVVHLHNTFPLVSAAAAVAAARRGVPVVQTLHNLRLVCAQGLCSRDGRPCTECLDSGSPLPALRHACYHGNRARTAVVVAWQLEQRALERARPPVSRYLAVSEFLRARLVGQGAVPAERTAVRHNHLADPGARHAAQDAGAVVYAGRLATEKGAAVLVRAAREAPEARVVVAGDGPDRAAVEALAARLGAANVSFAGRLARPELVALLRTARCLVQPSVCEDPNPTAVIEAAALGVPVIGARAGGIPETVGDGGVLVPPGDVGALAAALRDATCDPDRWAELGRAARRHYESRFTPARAYDTLIDAYGLAGVGAA